MPIHQHDCECCKFLGTAHYNGRKCDWYECYEGALIEGRRTIIARWGSDGPDYSSGTLFACAVLTGLEKKALALGLELSAEEKERLLTILLSSERIDKMNFNQQNKLYPIDGDDLLGNSNYYKLTR